jgi:hypothetical protein
MQLLGLEGNCHVLFANSELTADANDCRRDVPAIIHDEVGDDSDSYLRHCHTHPPYTCAYGRSRDARNRTPADSLSHKDLYLRRFDRQNGKHMAEADLPLRPCFLAPKKNQQNYNWQRYTQQPKQCAASQSHCFSPSSLMYRRKRLRRILVPSRE